MTAGSETFGKVVEVDVEPGTAVVGPGTVVVGTNGSVVDDEGTDVVEVSGRVVLVSGVVVETGEVVEVGISWAAEGVTITAMINTNAAPMLAIELVTGRPDITGYTLPVIRRTALAA